MQQGQGRVGRAERSAVREKPALLCLRARARACLHASVCLYVCLSVCLCVYTRVCICVCTCKRTDTNASMQAGRHECIKTHTHSHTHRTDHTHTMFTQALLGEKACGARQASSPSRRKRIARDTLGNSARFWAAPPTPTRRPLHTLGMCGITFTAPAHVPIHAIACTRYVWPQHALACIRVYAHAYRAL